MPCTLVTLCTYGRQFGKSAAPCLPRSGNVTMSPVTDQLRGRKAWLTQTTCFAPDEHVVIHKHPHWKMLIVPVLILLITVAVGVYLAALVASQDWHVIVWIALGVVGAFLIIWFVLTPLIRWRTTHFVFTTQRVMVREGVLSRTGIDIRCPGSTACSFVMG